MTAIAVLFAALGCAVIGFVAGAGMFALVFEILRARDLDAMLGSPGMLLAFRYVFALAGFGIGLFVILRRRSIRRDQAMPEPDRRRLLAALAGLGGAAIVPWLDDVGLAAIVGTDSYVFMMLASSALLMAAAAMIAIGVFERARPLASRIGRAFVGIGLSLLLILIVVGFNEEFSQPYERLGENKWSALLMLRFPEGARAELDKQAIRVELRSSTGTTSGFASEWLYDHPRIVLRANVDLPDRIRQRTIVVALPGKPELMFDLPFPPIRNGCRITAAGIASTASPKTARFARRMRVRITPSAT